MQMRLYEIKENYEILLAEIEAYASENNGEIPDSMYDQLDQIENDLQAKIISCGHVYKNALAESAGIDSEIKRLQARKKHADNVAEAMKHYIGRNMVAGVRFEAPTVAIGWRASEETVIDDMALIPQEYCKVKIEPAKAEIKKAIKAGVTVPGAHVEHKQNVQIK